MCRKCFRKIAKVAKDVHAFRDISLKWKEIQEININSRLKGGRNPYSPSQHSPEKKKDSVTRQSLLCGTLITHQPIKKTGDLWA